MFHKEGYKIISITLVLFIGINVASYVAIQNDEWRFAILALSLVLLFLILQFFRNPKRKTLVSNTTVVAPVDGKVVVIEEVHEKEHFNDNYVSNKCACHSPSHQWRSGF